MRPIVADVGLALWRLIPANPIVVRVVKGGSKRMQHLWVRVVYLLVLLFVMLVMLPWGTAGASLADLAKSSTNVFEYISILQLAMMCLLAPVFTAGAISQEKDAETFNVLLTTPLTNAQIALGSLLSRLFFVIALLMAGTPIFCITMLFGGVTSRQIFLSFGIAGCTALLTGSIAILISVIRVGTRGTIFSFYMGIAIFLATGLALGMWSRTYVQVPSTSVSGQGMSWLAPFHPFLAQAVALNWIRPPAAADVAHYAWPLNRMAASPHTWYMLMTLVVSIVLIGMATFCVRRGVKQGERSIWARLFRRRRNGEGVERRRRPRRVWANPVAWREAVTRASAASGNAVRYTYLIGGVVAATVLLFEYLQQAVPLAPVSRDVYRAALSVIVIIEFVTVMLMAANTAATAITREREAGTMELLLSTPLTSQYIVWGKLRGLIGFTLPLLALPAATVLAAAIIDLARGTKEPIAYMGSALLLPPLLLTYSAFACIIGLHMSLKCRRSVQAVIASIGILVAVGFGLGLCGMQMLGPAGAAGVVMAPLTFVSAIWLVLNPQQVADAAGSQSFPLTPGEAQGLCLIGVVIAVGIYGAIVAGTYRSMKRDFDMIVRKQSR